MHFLIDACLPRDFSQLLASHGHIASDVRDLGMTQADDSDIAAHAQVNQVCLLSEDWGFADIRNYPPEQYYGIVVFETVDQSIDEKLAGLRRLLKHQHVVENLAHRLAIVTSNRIRLRPPL